MKLFNILYYYYIGIIITKMERPGASRASSNVQSHPDHLSTSLVKGENFIQVNLFLENWRNSLIFHSINAKLINFFRYENMKNYRIFMRKSMKIKKISISSKTKKSFIFDGIIMKIINRDFPLKIWKLFNIHVKLTQNREKLIS